MPSSPPPRAPPAPPTSPIPSPWNNTASRNRRSFVAAQRQHRPLLSRRLSSAWNLKPPNTCSFVRAGILQRGLLGRAASASHSVSESFGFLFRCLLPLFYILSLGLSGPALFPFLPFFVFFFFFLFILAIVPPTPHPPFDKFHRRSPLHVSRSYFYQPLHSQSLYSHLGSFSYHCKTIFPHILPRSVASFLLTSVPFCSSFP